MNLSGSPAARARARVVALAGNPNVGKSTVFNALTGLKQHTGNWPGKTVGSARGAFSFGGETYELVDLPGTYSLLAHSPEEEIARDFLCFGNPDAVVVVCDATCLERNLILALQCLEITRRVVVCVNLMDQARHKGVRVDLAKLSALLGVPVVGTAARDRRTLDGLLTAVARLFDGKDAPSPPVSYGPAVERALARLVPALAAKTGDVLSARFLVLRLLETDALPADAAEADPDRNLPTGEAFAAALAAAREELAAEGLAPRLLRDHVVRLIVRRAETIGRAAVTNARQDPGAADRRLDRVFSSRALGFPVMLLMLALIFYLTIEGANYPSALLSRALFAVQDRLYALLIGLNVHEFVSGAVALGVFRVLAWVVSVMLPPMAIFFPLFTLLEDLGYLPRVAFNLDRCFQRCRACGKQALTMGAVAGGMRLRRRGKILTAFLAGSSIFSARWIHTTSEVMMNMQLTQKETMLLQDLKSQEQLCIDKYKKYAEQASDEQLKQLFSSIEQTEKEHLDTLTQMLSGTVPMMASSGSQQQQSSQQQSSQPKQSTSSGEDKQQDAYLCQDALSTEKHVSSSYNTSIFEFRDAQFRNALNHIQKEEQEHGKRIYDYMSVNAMYA